MINNRTVKTVNEVYISFSEFVMDIHKCKQFTLEDHDRISKRFKNILLDANSLPSKQEAFASIIRALAYYVTYTLTSDDLLSERYEKEASQIIMRMRKSDSFFRECLPYSNLLIYLFSITTSYCIQEYMQKREKYILTLSRLLEDASPDNTLTRVTLNADSSCILEQIQKNQEYILSLLLLTQNVNQKFITIRKDKNELIDKTAILLAAILSYLHKFHDEKIKEHVEQNKEKFASFFDIQEFIRLQKPFLAKHDDKLSEQDKCMKYWFEIGDFNIKITKESGNTIANKRLISSLFDYDYEKLIKFIRSVKLANAMTIHRPLPIISHGVNIYENLVDHFKMFTNYAVEYLTKHMIAAEEWKTLKCRNSAWSQAYLLVRTRIKILNFRKQLLESDWTKLLYSSAVCEELIVLDKPYLEAYNQLLEIMNNELNAEIKIHEEYYEALTDEAEAAKKEIRIKPRKNFVEPHVEISSESESDSESEEYEGNRIDIHIKNKQYDSAANLANSLRIYAKDTNDLKLLIRAFLYLGDIYRALALQQKNGMKSELSKTSQDNYQCCMNSIDEYLRNNQDEELSNLKIYLNELLLTNQKKKSPAQIKSNENIKISQMGEYRSIPAEITLPNYVNVVFNILINAGFQAYLTGGAIRDFLACGGLKDFISIEKSQDHLVEITDYDIATNASMQEIMKLFSGKGQLIGNRYPVFVIKSGHKEIQISTFTSLEDQSMPEMIMRENGIASFIHRTQLIKKDAEKRLLTCDALYYDGKSIHDYFNGLDDIKNQRIRFILDPVESINISIMVIFKIIRMIAKLNFSLDNEIKSILLKNIDKLKEENQDRVLHEFRRTMLEKNQKRVIELLREFKLFHLCYANSISQCFFQKPTQRVINNNYKSLKII